MPSIEAYVVVLVATVLTTLVLTPVVRRLAVRVGAVVKPDERRVHERPTPTLGGIAMFVGLLVGMVVAWRLDAFGEVFSGSTEPIGVVIAATLIIVVGVIDDLREVSAPAKMAGIVLAASVLVIAGISILVLRIPFQGTFLLSADWSYLLSVLWVLGMTNAINLIDGLDGLAAGIVAIAAGTFFLYALQLGDAGLLQAGNVGPLLAVIVLGMCLGFLPWNVHPAKIFMGDGGALLLGLLMAASTMVVGGRTDQPFSGQTFFFFAPLIIPLLILGVPILDTVLADRAAGDQAHGPRHRRQGPPPPPPDAPRARAPAQRAHPVGVDRTAVGLRALPDLLGPGQRHRACRHRGAAAVARHRAPPHVEGIATTRGRRHPGPDRERARSHRLACRFAAFRRSRIV